MKIYVFGNGNISFDDFRQHYEQPITKILKDQPGVTFLVCEFRGTDVLTLEFLKSKTANVEVFHVGERPRYFPDKFKTESGSWKINGGYKNDEERDHAALNQCTHFIAKDFNSDEKRKSGTKKNIEHCLASGKIQL